jgi:hypothetical protein
LTRPRRGTKLRINLKFPTTPEAATAIKMVGMRAGVESDQAIGAIRIAAPN